MQLITFAYPVHNKHGELVGVLSTALKLDRFIELFDAALLPPGASLGINDGNGLRLLFYPHKPESNPIGERISPQAYKAILGDKTEGVAYYKTLDDVWRHVAFRQLSIRAGDPPYLVIAVGIPDSYIIESADIQTKTYLKYFAVASSFSFALALFVGSHGIVNRLKRFASLAKRVGDGDLDAVTGMSGTSGTLGVVATAFDDMTAALRARESERQLAEKALRESGERFRQVVEGTDNLITQVDGTGHVLYVNPVARKIFGLEPEECVGRVAFDFVHPEDREATTAAFSQWTADRLPHVTYENRLMSRDGEVRWMLWNIDLHYDPDGRITVIDSIAQDMTELKKAEESLRREKQCALAAMHAKSEFLANMSHEIRTPISGILGILQLLQVSDLTEKQRQNVDIGIRSTQRLTKLLSDILDLSRIEAGKMPLQEARFEIRSLKDTLYELFGSVAKEKGLEFEVKIDERIPLVLVGDEIRLCQALCNLVGNAIKFTQRGGVWVDIVALSKMDDSFFRVLFMVKDTGDGISDDLLTRIFEPFVQGESSYVRRFQGAGLGLSIVGRVVDLLNGGLAIETELGQGTTVYFSIPFKIFADGSEKPAVPRTGSWRGEGSGLHILFAEDDPVTIFTVKQLLEQEGNNVVVATNGVEALSIVESKKFDLILMDVQMPVMDGIEVTRAIRFKDRYNSVRDIPIIALTSYALPGDKDIFIGAGMNGYISKPVDIDALKIIIAKVVGEAK